MIRGVTDTKNLINALRVLNKKEAPKAVAKGLNDPARLVEEEARRNAKSKLLIRKPYSLKGIINDRKAKGDNIGRMFSRTVVRNSYMISQEIGGTVKPPDGLDKIPIPTIFSRGGNIMKQIMTMFWINALKKEVGSYERIFLGTPKGGNRPLGIYYRWNGNQRLSLVRSMTKSSIVRKPVHYFKKAVDKYGDHEFVLSRIRRYVEHAIKKTGLIPPK